jgi:hypothetical protein
MRNFIILFVHIIVTLSRFCGPGGIRSVIAESVLVKQQLLILNRSRQRAQNLRAHDRFVAGLCSLFIQPTRMIRSAMVLKPSTLLSLHQALKKESTAFSSHRNAGESLVQRDHQEISSMPLSIRNSIILHGAAHEQPSKFGFRCFH